MGTSFFLRQRLAVVLFFWGRSRCSACGAGVWVLLIGIGLSFWIWGSFCYMGISFITEEMRRGFSFLPGGFRRGPVPFWNRCRVREMAFLIGLGGEDASSSGLSGSHRLQCLPPDRTCHVRFSLVGKNELLGGTLTDPTSVPIGTGSDKSFGRTEIPMPLFSLKKMAPRACPHKRSQNSICCPRIG